MRTDLEPLALKVVEINCGCPFTQDVGNSSTALTNEVIVRCYHRIIPSGPISDRRQRQLAVCD
jgi:hypothetical protein